MEKNNENQSNKKDIQDSKVGGTSKKHKRSEHVEDGRARALRGDISRADHTTDFKKPRREEEEEAIDLNDSKRSSNVVAGEMAYLIFGKDFPAKRSNEIYPAPMVTPFEAVNQDFQSTSQRVEDDPVRYGRGSFVMGAKLDARGVSTDAESMHSALLRGHNGHDNRVKKTSSAESSKVAEGIIKQYCRFCGKKFANHQGLAGHMKVHQKNDAITVATPGKFRCRNCGKSFSTHQALRVHNSSHFKSKIKIHDTIDEAPLRGHNNSVKKTFSAASSKVAEGIIKQYCRFCEKKFANHQGLAGHMKVHRTTQMSSDHVASSSKVTSPAEEAIPTTGKDPKCDLNEEPDKQDGDGPDS